MKKIILAGFLFLICHPCMQAQPKVLTVFEMIPLTPFTVTSPGSANTIYPGSLIRCTWTCTNDIAFGSRVKVLLVTEAQRTDLLAKMSRMGNIVPVDSIGRELFIKTSTDAYSVCYWDVPTTLAQGNYAVVVSQGAGKLGVGSVFKVAAIPPAPNVIYSTSDQNTPVSTGSVFGDTLVFNGRDIIPEIVQVFIGDHQLDLKSATTGRVVAYVSGTKPGRLRIGHGQPSNTVNILNFSFRPIGHPVITDIQPREFENGTTITIKGKDLDYVILRRHALGRLNVNSWGDSFPSSLMTRGSNAGAWKFDSVFNFQPVNMQAELSFLEEMTIQRAAIMKLYNDAPRDLTDEKKDNYLVIGPRIIKIKNYRVKNDGSSITFTVENVYNSFDDMTYSFMFEYKGKILDSSNARVQWMPAFDIKEKRGVLQSANYRLRWIPPQPPAPPPPPPPPPPFEVRQIGVNGLTLNQSNNAVIVYPHRVFYNNVGGGVIYVIGKNLDEAVVKLGNTVLVSGLVKNGIAVARDTNGNDSMFVIIPFSASSGLLEVSKGTKKFSIAEKLIITPAPRPTTIGYADLVTSLNLVELPVNTDITITGFDFMAPAAARGISIGWKLSALLPEGFSYKVVSTSQTSHVFRIEMAAGTPEDINIPGIGLTPVFGFGPGAIKFKIRIEISTTLNNEAVNNYEYYLKK